VKGLGCLDAVVELLGCSVHTVHKYQVLFWKEHLLKLFGALLTVLTTAVLPATATPVTAFVTYDSTPLGIFGDWSIHFTSGDPSVQITEVKITLNSKLFFDSAAGASASPRATYSCLRQYRRNAALVGLVGNNAANNPADGGKVLDLHFTNFTVAAGVFNFNLDVDKDNPLNNCAHLGILATIACNAANVVIATGNSLVSGSDFNGSQVEIFFGGGPAVTPPRSRRISLRPASTRTRPISAPTSRLFPSRRRSSCCLPRFP